MAHLGFENIQNEPTLSSNEPILTQNVPILSPNEPILTQNEPIWTPKMRQFGSLAILKNNGMIAWKELGVDGKHSVWRIRTALHTRTKDCLRFAKFVILLLF